MEILLTVFSAKLIGVILFTAIFPLTVISYIRLTKYYEYSNDGKNKIDKITEKLKIKKANISYLIPDVEFKFQKGDYFIPVGFASIICCVGSTLFFFGEEHRFAEKAVYLLSVVDTDDAVNYTYQNTALAVGTWAFLGAFIWSIQNALIRLVTIDLQPGVYYGLGIRMIFASFLAIAVYHLIASTDPFPANVWLPAGLIIGMFPQRWLIYLSKKIEKGIRFKNPFSDKTSESEISVKSENLPLDMIEGMSSFQRFRFNEIGIENTQNLANTHFIELLLKTPFKPYLIIDWIAQAKLYLYFQSDIQRLRKYGIRDTITFCELEEDDIELLLDKTGIDAKKIKLIHKSLKNDTSAAELKKAYETFKLWE